jgi:ferredoxin
MQSLRPGRALALALAVCSFLLGTCFLTAETSPVPAASFGEGERVTRETNPAEVQDKADFDILVEGVKFNEEDVTGMEKQAECPYRALSFDGITQVMCDYDRCDNTTQCKERCRQVFAYMKCDTRNITKKKPTGEFKRVYFGCIYEKINSVQSTEPKGIK